MLSSISFIHRFSISHGITGGIYVDKTPCVSYSLHAPSHSGSSATRHPKKQGGSDKRPPSLLACNSLRKPRESSCQHIYLLQCIYFPNHNKICVTCNPQHSSLTRELHAASSKHFAFEFNQPPSWQKGGFLCKLLLK